MRLLPRHAVCSLLISAATIAATNASAGVITQDGVVFTSTYSGKVLTLQIDAKNRSGGWASATALDAFSIKTIGSFSGVIMSSATSGDWALSAAELTAKGCGAPKGKGGTADLSRLCYSGAGVALADNMVFTFTFDGSPTLSAPHLKVHFVDARGNKVGSLLSMDFPAQAASGSGGSPGGTVPAPAPAPTPTPPAAPTPVVPEPVVVVPTPVVPDPVPAPPPTVPEPGLIPPPVIGIGEDGSSGDNLPVVLPSPDTVSDVPEPASTAMIAAGLALIGIARRRSRKARA